MAMAIAAMFRREGRRMAARLMTGHSINPIRSSIEEQAAFGVRSISNQIDPDNAKIREDLLGIIKGLNMFAASMVRAIQTKTENSRVLFRPFSTLLGDTPSVDVKKILILTIPSDKGLCGEISRLLNEINSGPGEEFKDVILGEKAKAQLIDDSTCSNRDELSCGHESVATQRDILLSLSDDSKKHIELSIAELQNNPLNYTQLADDILKSVENVEYDVFRAVFNPLKGTTELQDDPLNDTTELQDDLLDDATVLQNNSLNYTQVQQRQWCEKT